MEMKVFSIFDIKSGNYTSPMFFANRVSAIRAFEQQCRDKTSYLRLYPNDFALYEHGTLDMNTGELLVCEDSKPMLVISAAECVGGSGEYSHTQSVSSEPPSSTPTPRAAFPLNA